MFDMTNEDYKKFANFIKTFYGIDLKDEKQTLVTGRLQGLFSKSGYDSFSEYLNNVISNSNPETISQIVDKITTNHTFFMREVQHFYYFRDKVLPLLENIIKDNDLRIWCAACSTGEEAYTLSMIIDEYFGKNGVWWDKKLLATDLSETVLTTAQLGIYTNDKLAPLPQNWRNEYFKNCNDGTSEVIDRIKKEVIFRKFNLVGRDIPFKRKFHTIFCRNVMIYFDSRTRDALIERFYNLMEPGGYLFIGHSETINREISNFKYIMPAVYRKE